MTRHHRFGFYCGTGLLLACSFTAAARGQTRPVDLAADPTTRPSEASAASTASPTTEPTDFRQKLRDAFAQLELSDDQKQQLAGIFQTARDDAQQLRKDHPADPPVLAAMRRRHFLEDLRAKTDAVLTAAQRTQVAPAWQSIGPAHEPLAQAAPAAGPTVAPVHVDPMPVAPLQVPPIPVAAATTRPAPPPLAMAEPTTAPAAPPSHAAPTAAARPTPATAPAVVARRSSSRALPRLQAALAQLKLTDAQHQQITALVNDTQQQFAGLDGGDRAAKAKQVAQSVRGKLRDILTPDQLRQLREALRPGDDAPPPRTAQAAASPAAPPGDAPTQQADPKLIARGTPAPPFTLYNLDDDRITLSQFHGRVLVLVFGSYTSPVFRDRAAGLQKLWRTNEADDKAALFIVYTREAHPTNGWQVERNKTDKVLLPQTDTIESRRAAAAACKSALHLSIPMLTDTMDDAAATAYGAFPDGAVVIDRTGTVVSAEHWAEPTALQHAIDEAAKQLATTKP